MLTSQITMLALTSATKPSKWMPPTIASVIQSISTLTKNSAMPTVSTITRQREQLDDRLHDRVDDAEHRGRDEQRRPAGQRGVAHRGDRGVERDRVAGPGPDGALHAGEASTDRRPV